MSALVAAWPIWLMITSFLVLMWVITRFGDDEFSAIRERDDVRRALRGDR